jgi:hypothetical protein
MRLSEPALLVPVLAAATLLAACTESRPGNPAAPACTFAVSMSTSQFGPSGGSGSASITTGSGCAWTASTLADWITFQGSSSGSGSGTIAIAVAPHAGIEPRTASVAIAGQTLSLTQSVCDVRVTPADQQFSDSAGVGDAQIDAQPGCRWAVEDGVPWASIEPSSGVGSAAVKVRVAENNQGARQAVLRIGAARLAISQGAEPCLSRLTPPTRTFPRTGGDGVIQVETGGSCRWALAADAPWMRFVDPPSGVGPATVRFAVAPNADRPVRRATLHIAGASAEITEDGQDSCHFQLNPLTDYARLDGGPGEFAVTADPGCAWTASSDTSWLRVRAGSGVGSGRVLYDVQSARGPGGYVIDFRRGPIQVRWSGPTAGENMWVRQFPDCSTFFIVTPRSPGITASGMESVFIGPGGGTTHVTALTESAFSCPWTIQPPTVNWLTIDGPVFPRIHGGDGDLNFFVPPYSSPTPRTTVLIIGERSLTVTQSGQ